MIPAIRMHLVLITRESERSAFTARSSATVAAVTEGSSGGSGARSEHRCRLGQRRRDGGGGG
jgi:hypothetical protein